MKGSDARTAGQPGAGDRPPGRATGRAGGRIDARDTLEGEVASPSSAHGRYTVVRKLAEGGMAEIFLGRQHGSEGFEKPVVLKRIHTAFLADAQFRNMLIDEAHISMGLHHNNICQILDLGRAGGRLFLVLELVDGWDLARVLERSQAIRFPLPTGLGLYILAEVCRALSYAHGRTGMDGQPLGIVHRDVSPQNVLLSDQGEVKLTDFGIAKAMTKRERTATGVVKGKVAFMSPEQALGQPIDARSDLFSFGTLLYLVATGVRPFEAATDFEILARVQRGMFTPPEELRPELSPALSTLIKRAMTADLDQRYQTADELLVDLEGIWRGEYASPGQTELKLWLVELGRRDGVLTIGRSRPPRAGTASYEPTSSDLEEGQALVLGDEGSNELAGRQMARQERQARERGPERAPPDRGERATRPERLVRDRHDVIGGMDSDVDDAELGRLDTMSALEVPRKINEATYIVRPGDKPATADRDRLTPGALGIEDTSVQDLALRIGDEPSAEFRSLRPATHARRYGFVAFLVLTIGAAAVAWQMVGGAHDDAEAIRSPRPAPGPGASPATRPSAVAQPPGVQPPPGGTLPAAVPAGAGARPTSAGATPGTNPAAPPAVIPPPAVAPAAGDPHDDRRGGTAGARPGRANAPERLPPRPAWSPFRNPPVTPPAVTPEPAPAAGAIVAPDPAGPGAPAVVPVVPPQVAPQPPAQDPASAAPVAPTAPAGAAGNETPPTTPEARPTEESPKRPVEGKPESDDKRDPKPELLPPSDPDLDPARPPPTAPN